MIKSATVCDAHGNIRYVTGQAIRRHEAALQTSTYMLSLLAGWAAGAQVVPQGIGLPTMICGIALGAWVILRVTTDRFANISLAKINGWLAAHITVAGAIAGTKGSESILGNLSSIDPSYHGWLIAATLLLFVTSMRLMQIDPRRSDNVWRGANPEEQHLPSRRDPQ